MTELAERRSRLRPATERGTGSHRRGFTLIELTISLTILVIGVVSMAAATSSMQSLRTVNRESTIAQNALRTMSERIHARSYAFSEEESSWAPNLLGLYGPGGEFGDTFDVQGLAPGLQENTIGTIEIFTDETLTDDDVGYQLGLPRDLNGDGDALDGDVTASARILPVLLTLTWRGKSGERTLQHGFYVTGY